MKEIELTDGCFAARWGLTDFYKESEQRLRDALASGEDFHSSYGCKKEIDYCEIKRDADGIAVTVTAHMDDLWDAEDLIYDALWERLHIEGYEFSDEMIDSIRDTAIDNQLNDYSQTSETLPANTTFEQLCETISALESKAHSDNKQMFDSLCDIVENSYKGKDTEPKPAAGDKTPIVYDEDEKGVLITDLIHHIRDMRSVASEKNPACFQFVACIGNEHWTFSVLTNGKEVSTSATLRIVNGTKVEYPLTVWSRGEKRWNVELCEFMTREILKK